GGFDEHFPEAEVGLGDVEVDRECAVGETIGAEWRYVMEALSARVVVVPNAYIEGEGTEGRPNAAVEVDLGRRAVGKADALAADAGVELQILVDVVSRLEVGGDGRPVVRLRNAAEYVIAHYGGAERQIPWVGSFNDCGCSLQFQIGGRSRHAG